MAFVIEDDDDAGYGGGGYGGTGSHDNPYDMIDLSEDLTTMTSSAATGRGKNAKTRRSDTSAGKSARSSVTSKTRKRGSKSTSDGTDDVLADILGDGAESTALKERRRATWASRLSGARGEPAAAKTAPPAAAPATYDAPLSPSAAARGRVVMGVDSLRDMLGPDARTMQYGTAAPRAPAPAPATVTLAAAAAPTPIVAAPAPVYSSVTAAAAAVPAPAPAPPPAPAPQPRVAAQFPVGTRVHARFGGSDWFPGVIAAIQWLSPTGSSQHPHSSSPPLEPVYEVQYDDGEVEETVHPSNIKLEPAASVTSRARFANADSPTHGVASHIAAAVVADEASVSSVPEDIPDATHAPVASAAPASRIPLPVRAASPSQTSSPRYEENFESDSSYRSGFQEGSPMPASRPALPARYDTAHNVPAPSLVAAPAAAPAAARAEDADIPEDEYAPDFDASASAAQLLASHTHCRERSNSLGRPQSAGRRPRSAASVNVAWQEPPARSVPPPPPSTVLPHYSAATGHVHRVVVRDAEVQTELVMMAQPPQAPQQTAYAQAAWGAAAAPSWNAAAPHAAPWGVPTQVWPAAPPPPHAYGYAPPSFSHAHADIAASVQRFLRGTTGDASPAATAAYLRAFADSLAGVASPPVPPAYTPGAAYAPSIPSMFPSVPAYAPDAAAGEVQPAVARALAQYREALSESDMMFSKQLELLRETVARNRMRTRVHTPLGTLSSNAPVRTPAESMRSLASSFASADTRATMTSTLGGGQRVVVSSGTHDMTPGLAETREYVAAHRRRELTVEEARERVRLQDAGESFRDTMMGGSGGSRGLPPRAATASLPMR